MNRPGAMRPHCGPEGSQVVLTALKAEPELTNDIGREAGKDKPADEELSRSAKLLGAD